MKALGMAYEVEFWGHFSKLWRVGGVVEWFGGVIAQCEKCDSDHIYAIPDEVTPCPK
jgi:hypothetical protein